MSLISSEYGPQRYFGRDGKVDYKFSLRDRHA